MVGGVPLFSSKRVILAARSPMRWFWQYLHSTVDDTPFVEMKWREARDIARRENHINPFTNKIGNSSFFFFFHKDAITGRQLLEVRIRRAQPTRCWQWLEVFEEFKDTRSEILEHVNCYIYVCTTPPVR